MKVGDGVVYVENDGTPHMAIVKNVRDEDRLDLVYCREDPLNPSRGWAKEVVRSRKMARGDVTGWKPVRRGKGCLPA